MAKTDDAGAGAAAGKKANTGTDATTGKEEEKQKKTAERVAWQISALIQRMPGVDVLSGKTGAGREKADSEKKAAKGVRVTFKDSSVLANIHVFVDFGKSIPEIARHIQNEAKTLLQSAFPDRQLAAVHIWVDGVRFDRDSVRYREEAIASLEEDGG